MTTNPRSSDYASWTRQQLIERVLALEGPRSGVDTSITSSIPETQVRRHDIAPSSKPQARLSAKKFHIANHPKRKIALKFCYSGWEYSGLAYQRNITVPTVEAVLFDAMTKARLVDPGGGLEGCGWEKCGRTDSGVSAAGQVISLWIRSAIGSAEGSETNVDEKGRGKSLEKYAGLAGKAIDASEDSGLPGLGEEDFGTLGLSEGSTAPSPNQPPDDLKPQTELDYIAILNRLLPPTIRILAWAPVASTFSARFSCKYRHYKYFFSSRYLNISAMREAATRLIGEHDFRNMCKIDAPKQLTRFSRNISRADIEPVDQGVDGRGEEMFVFNLVGSAFLYHQVRHIMAVLFMIGTGLEKPSLVTRLLNVTENAEPPLDTGKLEVVDRKPEYQMADALPLMLWDCGYADEDVKWRTETLEPLSTLNPDEDNETDTRRSGLGTETDLYHQLHSIWDRSRVYTTLDRHFLQAAERYHRPSQHVLPLPITISNAVSVQDSDGPVNYPLGGGTYKRVHKYVPVLNRNRLDTVETINERWRLGKGMRRTEKRGENGNGDDHGGDE